MVKDVVEDQKNMMDELDIDQLGTIRDEMDELNFKNDYINEQLNREYGIDIDEDELYDELK